MSASFPNTSKGMKHLIRSVMDRSAHGDDSSSVASLVASATSSSDSSSSSLSSTTSSLKRRWNALALHRFLSPQMCAREPIPLSQTKLETLLRTLPTAITTRDRCMRTPLHLACSNRYVTSKMLSVLIDAPGGKEALMIQDNRGFTPLHCSVRYHPDANLISTIVEADPRTTSVRDNAGMTPLHHACFHLNSISSYSVTTIEAPTVALLLRHDPSIVCSPDREGNTPFSLVCNKFDLICRHGFYSAAGRPRIITFGSFLFLERSLPLWRAVASCNNSEEGGLILSCEWDNMLHYALAAIKVLSTRIDMVGGRNKVSHEFAILSIIHKCRDQTLTVDSNGNTPLHVACTLPVSSVPVGSRLLYPTVDKHVIRDQCLVDYLVRICPEAAKRRNKDGKLPLHSIIDAEGTGPLSSRWQCGVRAILGANPGAVAELDIDSRLYPRVLGRSGKDIGVSSIYSILKEKPELLSMGSVSEDNYDNGTMMARGKRLKLLVVRRKRRGVSQQVHVCSS